MKRLAIHNVGPIRDVDIELNRFNFFIGPQSSGKSTVAKILSTCSWIEKEVATTLNENVVPDADAFRKLIEVFHKMEGYFKAGSEIVYDTDVIRIHFDNDANNLQVNLKDNGRYEREKICYIPSDRNMVTLPELQGFEFGATNIRSFLFDWMSAREFYNSENKASILNLDVKYFYDKNETKYKDRIEHVNGETYGISLACASSGMQSVVPMQILLQYYTGQYYNELENKISFDLNAKKRALRKQLIMNLIVNRMKVEETDPNERLQLFNDGVHAGNAEYIKWLEEFNETFERLTVPHKSCFIIEEPEQNLFPFTQLELIEELVRLCSSERNHGFTVTTHSPYIVNFLNVLILRHYKGVTEKTVLNADELSVFAVQNGRLVDMMQENTVTGLRSVKADDLTEAMEELYTEYRELKRR